MPVHDWTQVDAGVFHSFHTTWIAQINSALNAGLLPKGYYALAEQHTGKGIADVLALHASPPDSDALRFPPLPPDTGGIALAEAPPRVHRVQTVEQAVLERRRSIAIRHISGHRLIALIEIVSPSNKDRAAHVQDFVSKALDMLDRHVHLLLVDLFPPGTNDPSGMHGVIYERIAPAEDAYSLPGETPLTLASYVAQPKLDIYLEHLAVGVPLTPMPLFLRPDRYINVPLEETYMAAYRGMPAIWRGFLEGARE